MYISYVHKLCTYIIVIQVLSFQSGRCLFCQAWARALKQAGLMPDSTRLVTRIYPLLTRVVGMSTHPPCFFLGGGTVLRAVRRTSSGLWLGEIFGPEGTLITSAGKYKHIVDRRRQRWNHRTSKKLLSGCLLIFRECALHSMTLFNMLFRFFSSL